MKLFDLTDQYFVILMIISGGIVCVSDYKAFKKQHMMDTAKKAKVLGRGAIIVSVFLFILSKFVVK